MIGFDFDIGPVVIDERGYYSTFHSERGPVARHIRYKTRGVTIVAKGRVGKDTGRLMRSIKDTRVRGTREYTRAVGAARAIRNAL